MYNRIFWQSQMNKNTEKNSPVFLKLEPEIHIRVVSNQDSKPLNVQSNPKKNFIQLHFCLDSQIIFSYNENSYHQVLDKDIGMLLYNPKIELSVQAILKPKSKLISILIGVNKIHQLLSQDENQSHFLQPNQIGQKYYAKEEVKPSIRVILSQMMNDQLSQAFKNLYLKAKVYELICIYFHKDENISTDQCPFLANEDNLIKIREAKKILLEQMDNPPSIKQLSRIVQLNEYKLKAGFKNMYGTTIYSFLMDYKMDYARKLIETSNKQIKEIAYLLGYGNPSHFITAFKKKYGTTPKKYAKF